MEQATDQQLQLGKWLAGAAVGAAAMYLFDPERGAARRTQSGRKLRELGHQGSDMFGKAAHSIGARAGEVAHSIGAHASEAGGALRKAAGGAAAAVHDLAAGSASQAGHAMQNISAGAHEAGAAAQAASTSMAKAGDGHDEAALARHGTADSSPGQPVHELIEQAKQIGSRVVEQAGAWRDTVTATGTERGAGTRVAALAGATLALYGLFARRSPLGAVAGLAGLALLARGAGTTGGRGVQPARSRGMLKSSIAARPVVIEKTIRIDASPEQVYDLFANYENFPRYMSNVIEVRDLGERRSHWVVRGPAGTHFQWNAVLTESTRPRRLAWESEPGAEVEQTGAILFEPFRNGTRVTVTLSYRPPAGMVGHALASLLGSDPGKQMDEDLGRMKSLVERGALTRYGGPRNQGASSFLH